MDDTIHRSYEGFAYVYDTFMDNVPYEEWAEYVTKNHFSFPEYIFSTLNTFHYPRSASF